MESFLSQRFPGIMDEVAVRLLDDGSLYDTAKHAAIGRNDQGNPPNMRFAVFAMFLAVCGCAQCVHYPPTGKGWVKLNDAGPVRAGPLARPSSYLPVDFHPAIVIDPVYGTDICNGARAFRLDFTGKWRLSEAWPWFGPSGGIWGGQVVIYLHAGRSAYYRFYHGPIELPGGRPDVTIAAACYNPLGYFGDLQNEPDNPMTAQVTFR
jgi:hypothetical protein